MTDKTHEALPPHPPADDGLLEAQMCAGLWELALLKTHQHPTLAVTPAVPTR